MSGSNRGNFSFSLRRPGQLSGAFSGRPQQQQQSQQQQQQQQQKSFSLNAVPPPSSLCGRGSGFAPPKSFNPDSGVSKHGYHTMDAIAAYSNPSSQYTLFKRRGKTEDDYFEEEEEPAPQLEYIPAPGSPSASGSQDNKRAGNKSDDNDEDDEDDADPLDAFMAGIEAQVEREKKKIPLPNVDPKKGVRHDIDDEDNEESYYRYMEENPNAGVLDGDGSDAELEYDEDGNPIPPVRKRDIDPLPPIYHSEIEYDKFEKNFYIPHEDILGLSVIKTEELRKKLGVKVSGPLPPAPVTSFAHFGFDESLMKAIRKSEYTQPTPIQAQSVPAALSGRDIIGIAKTGSGKTAAFLWPMLVHIMDQKELGPGDGPIGLILAPTRELSLQIYQEAKKFGKIYNISVCCCYGGGSKWEQSKALEQGAEIVVATPGRMIDMVKMKATNLKRVTYLVLDEADKMFNMGFEPQVRSICNHVRPDRQTLLFSATFKKRIERLARDVLTDPVRIMHGDLGEANQDVTQHVIVFHNPTHKWSWLLEKMVQLLSEGSVLIFVTKKADADQVANNLKLKEYDPVLLHGDMDQADRNTVITQFKRREVDIMVATDVAARGLDIPHIRNVINYDIARDIDTHTHRIGRTGRAGEKGTAYTLVTDKDKEFAGHLVRNLEGANQEVSDELMKLAMQSSWFRNSRFKQNNKGKNMNVGGAGLGFRSRPVPSGPLKPSDGSSSSSADAGGGVNTTSKGPATDRFTAMRETFKAQYNAQFKASSDRTWENTIPEGGVFAKPAMQGFVAASCDDQKGRPEQQQEHQQQEGEERPRKKKSRWN
ncbi:ATP-dependent RNA helicase DDX42 [Toxorhynchites rutilus septentrionalis]|uniref:ATP-dependent RNA helicase DDX42 n=1 Tax=Toxorhynchites rutilus septentrionalis TaxID=329112 RepID=UPI0024793857|nr:ATP-dependent RNA helicase DDX42 [Toxorhynchites rutilus septentrionalis]